MSIRGLKFQTVANHNSIKMVPRANILVSKTLRFVVTLLALLAVTLSVCDPHYTPESSANFNVELTNFNIELNSVVQRSNNNDMREDERPQGNSYESSNILREAEGKDVKFRDMSSTLRETERRQANHPEPSSNFCDDGLPAPDEPFRVVWNHPDHCELLAPLHLTDFGIAVNSDRQWYGDQVKLFYAPGEWPSFDDNGTAVHGGLPQTVDLHHFDAVRDYFLERLDSPDFSGLAVIDYENWRPVYEGLFGNMHIYQNKSRELAHLLHPELNTTEIYLEAEMEFNYAARNVFEKTLSIGQELMPRGHWGYYYYPRIWGDNVSHTAFVNDKLDWLWEKSTGLFPRIYMSDLNPPVTTRDTNTKYVRETLKEARRVKETFSRPNTPIYGYAKSQYGMSNFYDTDDLDVGIGMPALMGADGVVLWGSSYYYRQDGFCQRLENYIRDVLGPYVLNLTRFTKDCSQHLCASHGRCVHNNIESLPLPLDTTQGVSNSRFHDYHCQCYHPWTGSDCKTRLQSPCQPTHGSSTGHTAAPLVG